MTGQHLHSEAQLYRRFVEFAKLMLHTFRLAARAGDVQRIASCLGHARRTSSHARMLRELAARH